MVSARGVAVAKLRRLWVVAPWLVAIASAGCNDNGMSAAQQAALATGPAPITSGT